MNGAQELLSLLSLETLLAVEEDVAKSQAPAATGFLALIAQRITELETEGPEETLSAPDPTKAISDGFALLSLAVEAAIRNFEEFAALPNPDPEFDNEIAL